MTEAVSISTEQAYRLLVNTGRVLIVNGQYLHPARVEVIDPEGVAKSRRPSMTDEECAWESFIAKARRKPHAIERFRRERDEILRDITPRPSELRETPRPEANAFIDPRAVNAFIEAKIGRKLGSLIADPYGERGVVTVTAADGAVWVEWVPGLAPDEADGYFTNADLRQRARAETRRLWTLDLHVRNKAAAEGILAAWESAPKSEPPTAPAER